MIKLRILISSILLSSMMVSAGWASGFQFRGVNIAGAEFGTVTPPSWYRYPNHAEMDYFSASHGMNLVRVPFRWERMQPTLNGPLDMAELAKLDEVIAYALTKGLRTVLDPHNFTRYNGILMGSGSTAPTAENLADLWSKLATHYCCDTTTIFGLMNEPIVTMQEWLDAANKSIAAIRATGAKNLIFVPGNYWDGASHWLTDQGGGQSNGTVMLGVVDPLNNYIYEVHQYFDKNYSGTSPNCISAAEGTKTLTAITDWAWANKKQLFLGEFAVSSNPQCLAVLNDVLTFMSANARVWYGWAYWAAGPWSPTYPFSVEGAIVPPPPQELILEGFAK